MKRRFFHHFIDLLYPNLCLICNESLMSTENQLCLSCFSKMPKTNYHLLQDNSVFDLYEGQAWISVRSFIHISCDWIEDRKRRYKEMGADSYCKALVNLTLQASFFCPAAMKKAFEFSARENGIWSDILKHGIESGELRKDTDVAFIARYIQHLYYGSTFMGALRPEGGDIQFLRKQLLYIYETIKY